MILLNLKGKCFTLLSVPTLIHVVSVSLVSLLFMQFVYMFYFLRHTFLDFCLAQL